MIPAYLDLNALTPLYTVDTTASDRSINCPPYGFLNMSTTSDHASITDLEYFKAGKTLKYATFLDKLKLVYILGTVAFVAPYWALRYVLTQPNTNIATYVRSAIMRYVAARTSLEQMRVIIPCVPLRSLLNGFLLRKERKIYNNYNKMFPVEGTAARWLYEVPNRTPKDPVLLYLHGGGYYLTTMPEQVQWILRFSDRLEKHRLSVLELDYTVTPEGRFPQQRDEAFAVYRELLKSCTKIITLGDSAGGHLAVTLQDALYGSPLPKPFGCVLVSPWVDLRRRDYGSYKHNEEIDYLALEDRVPLRFCTREQFEDVHSNPNAGDSEFWLPRFVGTKTVTVWGQREVLRDTCKEMAEKIGCKDVFEQPNGLHDVLALAGTCNETDDYLVQTVDRWLSL